MPQIPYTPFSTVDPSSGGGEHLTVSTPPDAFGTGIARAVEGLGSTLEKSGDELFTRAMALQDLRNETDAREAQTQYAQKASELHASYGALEGKAAADGLQGYIKAQADLRTQYRDGLKTQFAQRYYDRDTLPFMQRNIFSAAGHAADENKRSVIGTAEANMDLSARTFVDPKSASEFQSKIDNVKSQLPTVAATRGLTQPQVDDYLFKRTSNLWFERINAVAHEDPHAAMDMFDANKSSMTQTDADKALIIARTQMHQTGARSISRDINGDLDSAPDPKRPEKGLQARIQEGMAIAAKQQPNDPDFPDYVRDRIETDYNKAKSAQRDFQFSNTNTVAGALVTGAQNGAIPSSVEELRAVNPKVAAAWDNLPPTVQRTYLKDIANNSKGDHAWTVDGLKRYQQLKGMASDNPADFLDMSMVGEKIPMAARKGLIDLQQKIKNDAGGDPRLTRAWGILQPTLQSAGILDDKDQRQQFRGALSDAIEDFQTEHKKSPNTEETKLIGTQLMQQFKTQNWFFDRNVPLFQAPIPSDLLDSAKTKAAEAKEPIPSDEQIRREYVRQNYQKLYGSSAKKPTTGKGNPAFAPNENIE